LLFIILLLYKSPIIKVVMVGLFPFSTFYQLGMIMGFTSYLHFLIFLPQAVLIVAGTFFLYQTHVWRTV